MTVRAQTTPHSDRALISTLQKEPVFMELVETDRKADFWWLAQSRGFPTEKIERLWQALRALAGIDDSARPEDTPGGEVTSMHRCRMCGRTFNSDKELRDHEKMAHKK